MITVLGVGYDIEKEAPAVDAWLEEHRPAHAVCWSPAMFPRLDPRLGVRAYLDAFTQNEELALFRRGYDMAAALCEFLEPRTGRLGRMMMAGFHHVWARDLYWLAGAAWLAQHHESLTCIVDHPYRPRRRLAGGWTYQHLSTMAYPYPVERALSELAAGHPHQFEEERRRLGSQSLFTDLLPVEPGRPVVLVLVEDTGSMVNLTSARAIVAALDECGVTPVILTSSRAVNDALRGRWQVHVLDREPPPSLGAAVASELQLLHSALEAFAASHDAVEWQLFASMNVPRLTTYVRATATLDAGLLRLVDGYGTRVALAVNEGTMLPGGTARWFLEHGLLTIGVTPILLMDHPTCTYWPAQQHLVYGEQAVELLAKSGVSPDRIHVVGSEHFDRCVRRNSATSAAWVRASFPQIAGRKLVLVATEARPRQMLEIEPTLQVLSRMEDVYTIVMLHPDDQRAQFEPLLAGLGNPPHMQIVQRSDSQALLQSSDLMITMGSNLIVEGAAMGKLSLVYNFSGTPCPIDFVEEGICFGATTPEELEQRVRALVFDPEWRGRAMDKLRLISRFNGPNDGQSARRVAAFVAQRLDADRDPILDSPYVCAGPDGAGAAYLPSCIS